MTLVEHVKECGCDACKAFDARRFDEMRSVVGHSASDFAVAQPALTADTITEAQIRELLSDDAARGAERQAWLALAALGDSAAMWSLGVSRSEARARCAEILNARRSA